MDSIGREATVRVAVVQAGAVPFDSEACVDKAVRLIGEAAASGAKVILFPEAFIVGYPKGLDYGLVVGARDAAGREEFRLYLDAAIEVPGPQTQRLGEAAAAHGSYVVIGVIERELGTCYCTVLFFGPDGSLLGKHRKLMPTAMERMIWGFGDGSTLTVVDSPYGRIGSVICWENYMPMLRMAMYAKNVALYCAPTADDRDTWMSIDAAYRARRALLRADGLPVHPQEGVPGYRARVARRFAGRGADARRQRHHQSSGQGARRPRISTAKPS